MEGMETGKIMDEWSDNDLYRIAVLFGDYRILWDREHPEYYNLQERYHAYCNILEGLCMPSASVSDVLSLLRELRCAYVTELRRMQLEISGKNERLSGGSGTYRPVAKWFWVMHGFLYDHLDADEGLTKIPDTNINENDSTSLMDECFCKIHDIDTAKNPVMKEDCPGLVMYQVVTGDNEKKCCKVDEKNDIARGNEKFSATSLSSKGEILFIRAPRELQSIRMNTVCDLADRCIDVSSKILSKDEILYNTCYTGCSEKALNENVNERTCCCENRGACRRKGKNEDHDKNSHYTRKNIKGRAEQRDTRRVDKTTSGEIICCQRS